MKRNKITAVIMSIVMSMSLMMPSVVVLADEASAPSETQKTETVETKEPKAAEKQTPKETEKQEPAESKDNGDNPEESNETAVVEGNIPSQSASSPKKNAVTGTCGDNLTWSYANGTLTISGSGKMTNWTNSGEVPWREYLSAQIISVVFSGNITSIGDYAFSESSSLRNITIPDSVDKIGDSAFYHGNLKSITIPDSVEYIGKYAFGEQALTSITIPDGVEYIGNYAFYFCFDLTSVTIPDSVMSIGDYVFRECENLKSIKLPKSVKKYGTGVLKGCRNLTSLELPKGVTSIGENEFHNYSYLKSVTIPESVEIIGKEIGRAHV